VKAERGETGRDLPAPYRNPWHLLARDLRAVLADAGLRARELWRRNREADLWLPPRWPAALAAWFWPLVLLAALLVPFGLWRLLPHPAAVGRAPHPGQPADPDQPLQATKPVPPPAEPPPPSPPEGTGQPAQQPIPPATPPTAEPVPPASEEDPLLALLEAEVPGQGSRPLSRPLILSSRSDPGEAQLTLILAPAFAALSAEPRARQAERWRRRAEALGFDHLELRDGAERLLGRNALVGSGMILLDPPRSD
jgi:hypothetical protein